MTAGEIAERLDPMPFLRFHLHIVRILGVGTFFDAFDAKSCAMLTPTRAVSQSIDLVVKDRNLVESGFDAKRDPTQDTDSLVQSMTCMHSQVGSLLEAISHPR